MSSVLSDSKLVWHCRLFSGRSVNHLVYIYFRSWKFARSSNAYIVKFVFHISQDLKKCLYTKMIHSIMRRFWPFSSFWWKLLPSPKEMHVPVGLNWKREDMHKTSSCCCFVNSTKEFRSTSCHILSLWSPHTLISSLLSSMLQFWRTERCFAEPHGPVLPNYYCSTITNYNCKRKIIGGLVPLAPLWFLRQCNSA